MNKYVLIITEKPDAAKRIATSLDVEERPRKMSERGVPYYVAKREREIVVVPALGHLYTITDEKKGRSCPAFSYKWVPRYLAEKGTSRIHAWLQIIAKLAKDADVFIDACDYDIEGSLIGYCILKYACGDKEHTSRRMKYSTLTKGELEQAYSRPLPHLDFGLVEAGRTRHEVDWLYGINLSRALTNAAKSWSRKFTNISTGRVQGPTLAFLVEREEAIRAFVPVPYWRIKALVEIDGQTLEATHAAEKIDAKREAEAITASCKGKDGLIEDVNFRQFKQPPPFPFDLGSLQNEAYSLFRYSPRLTSGVAQRLYLDALISYPRTSSQKLPATIDYRKILKDLSRSAGHEKSTLELLAMQTLEPNEGKKDDPAHPAIYPTGTLPERTLEPSEKRIWDLVVRRFMAVFAKPALKQNITVDIKIDGQKFYLEGKQVLSKGWIHYYEPYARFEEVLLPPVEEGQLVKVEDIILEDKFTEPPSRYNPSSLLREMEEAGIGTKATRADIIQTLYERGYVEREGMAVTGLGFEVVDVLTRHCPAAVSTELTRELETKMERIQQETEKREEVVAEAIRMLKPVLEQLKREENVVGEQLTMAVDKARREENTIGPCPVCKTGELIINYSRKTGKRFVGCTNYFKGICTTSFPLPQRGTAKPTGKNCSSCNWPTVVVRSGRRLWILCFNPICPSRRRA